MGPFIDTTRADHAEAVVHEAVSNPIRHGEAAVLTVTITVDDVLPIAVTDSGRGIGVDVSGAGLADLVRREAGVGAPGCREAATHGGTALTWRAPLPVTQDCRRFAFRILIRHFRSKATPCRRQSPPATR